VSGPLNLPNLLTSLRLVLAAPVIAATLGGHHLAALALLAAAASTDVLDGYLARRLHASTRVGAWLDPLADKALLSGAYLALALSRTAPWWFVGLVLGRDVYILLGAAALWAFTRTRQFPPSHWGKLSTFIQIVAAVLLMTRNAFPEWGLDGVADAAVWPAAAATLVSGVHYTWRAVRQR
jgi:cardiolipin synthase